MAAKFAVIGMGRFGSAIARTLSERGAEVLAIDKDESRIEAIKNDVAFAVALDSTNNNALISQGIEEVDAVVVAIGEDFEALILTIAYLKEMKIKRLIARANGPQQRMILQLMGVDEVLSPEDEVGIAVAEMVLNPGIISSLSLPDGYEIAEIKAPKSVVNRTLEDVGFRHKYKLSVITIQRTFEREHKGEMISEKHVLGVPSASTVIDRNDTLMVFGHRNDIQRFIEINLGT